MPLLPPRRSFPPYPYAPVTAVQSRSTTTLAVVKERLGITGTAEDTLISSLLVGAKQEADLYLNNPFTAREASFARAAPAVELPIPAQVEEGLIELIRSRRATAARGAKAANVQREKIDDLERTYFEGGVVFVEDEIKSRLWRLYRLSPIG